MKTLTIALFAEGSTDYRFLTILVHRTIEMVLCQNGANDIVVLEPIPINPKKGVSQEEKILKAALDTNGMDFLIIHLDADGRDYIEAHEQRFIPGKQRVETERCEVCRSLIPIIPIKMIEVWTLSDPGAFQRVVGTRLTEEELGIPRHPHQLEAIPEPKQVYKEAIRLALTQRRNRRQRIDPGIYFDRLGREIDLNRLRMVPSFERFTVELTEMLKKLSFICEN